MTRITRGKKEIVRKKETFELQRFAKFAKSPHCLKTRRKETVNLAFRLLLQGFFWLSESQNKYFTVFLIIRYLQSSLGISRQSRKNKKSSNLCRVRVIETQNSLTFFQGTKKSVRKKGTFDLLRTKFEWQSFTYKSLSGNFHGASELVRKKETFEFQRFELWRLYCT